MADQHGKPPGYCWLHHKHHKECGCTIRFDPPKQQPKAVIDFNSDEPLVCNRDQSGDTTCESCQ